MASPSGGSRSSKIPEFLAGSGGRPLQAVGVGTASFPFVAEDVKNAVLAALELGYRHLDTASVYGSEQLVGEAVTEAARRGVIESRGEVFVTTKVWCTQCHPDLVLPSLKESLQNLQMEYVDLYLVHWPMSVKPSKPHLSMKREDIVPMDLRGVWQAMEECHSLGLAKMIGVSNFTTKKLQELLAIAKIPPAVNQVELNPIWQQKRLIEFCKEKGIHVTAYSPLGGQSRISKINAVLPSEVLKEIAEARGKSVAQISLRWIYEQGVSMVAKSMKKERLKENIEIFDWELTDEDRFKIAQIPQHKKVTVLAILSPEGVPGVDFSELDVVEMLLAVSRNLQMEYVDLYLIHWLVSLKPGPAVFPAKREDAVPFDFDGVWREMEECRRLGLAKAIGVSNFTTSHLDKILATATVPPAVNQVEMNPVWQQRKLREYCAEKGIHVAAYSPLGGQNWSGEGNAVLDSQVLAEIAEARGKSIAQVALRWIYEQGVSPIVKSFSKERLKQNLEIFDWELTEEDLLKISQIPQKKMVTAAGLFSSEGEFTSVDLADMEIVET